MNKIKEFFKSIAAAIGKWTKRQKAIAIVIASVLIISAVTIPILASGNGGGTQGSGTTLGDQKQGNGTGSGTGENGGGTGETAEELAWKNAISELKKGADANFSITYISYGTYSGTQISHKYVDGYKTKFSYDDDDDALIFLSFENGEYYLYYIPNITDGLVRYEITEEMYFVYREAISEDNMMLFVYLNALTDSFEYFEKNGDEYTVKEESLLDFMDLLIDCYLESPSGVYEIEYYMEYYAREGIDKSKEEIKQELKEEMIEDFEQAEVVVKLGDGKLSGLYIGSGRLIIDFSYGGVTVELPTEFTEGEFNR